MKHCVKLYAVIAILALAVTLAGYAGGKPEAGAVTLTMASHPPHADWARAVAPMFAEETGMKIEVLDFPLAGLLEKQMVESMGRTGAFDIIELWDAWNPLFVPEGHLAEIPAEWVAKMELKTDFPPAVDSLMSHEGKYYLVPQTVAPFTLYYRVDWFNDPQEKARFKAEYGYDLAPPKTPEQLIEIAKFFTRDTNNDGRADQWGYSYIGQVGSRMNYVYLQQVKAYGGEIFDANMRVAFANEAGEKAMQFFIDVLPWCPPGTKTYTWADAYEAFAQGKVAMVQQWALIGQMIDAGNLPVKGKYAVAPLPTAKGVPPTAMLANWFMGVSAYSKNKDAAFKALEFLGSTRATRQAALGGSFYPSRFSVIKDPELNAKFPWYADVLKIFDSDHNWFLPQIPEFPELGDLGSAVVHETIDGKYTPRESVRLIKQRWEEVLARAGYY